MYGLIEKWLKKGVKMSVGYDIPPTKISYQTITKKQDKKKVPIKGLNLL